VFSLVSVYAHFSLQSGLHIFTIFSLSSLQQGQHSECGKRCNIALTYVQVQYMGFGGPWALSTCNQLWVPRN